MKKLLKKLILSGLAGLILLFSLAPFFPTRAQDSTWYNQDFVDWYTKVYDTENPSEIFGERYTAAQVQWVVWSLVSLPLNFLGKDNQAAITCVIKLVDQNQIDLSECKEGIIGLLERIKDFFKTIHVTANTRENVILTSVFDYRNRPLSGIAYVSNLITKFHLIPEAKAQGFGYTALSPVQKYWSGIRNIAYALIVLVVIIFAFMIMFRVKISPQLVISIQSALPKIIAALILATFSYAIAGFLIDFMYVVGGLFASLLHLAGFASDIDKAYRSIFPTDNYGFYILGNMFAYLVVFVLSLVLSLAVIAASIIRIVPGVFFGILVLFLAVGVLVLTIWYSFKIPWVLIKNLISIYVSIIIAPLQIVLGALVPQIGFGTWLKKMVAELLVFPVTGLFLFMAWSLLWTSFKFIGLVFIKDNIISGLIADIITIFGGDTSWFNVIWVPSIIGYAETLSPLIILLASFGIIVALPKVVNILKMFIMGEKFTYGTAVGEAIEAGKVAGGIGLFGITAVSKERYPWPIARWTKDTPPPKWLSDLADMVKGGLSHYSQMTKGKF